MTPSESTNPVRKLLGRMSMKVQLGIGFALLLLIVVSVSLGSLHTLTRLEAGVNEVTEQVQPVALSALALEGEIEAAGHALGFLLLTGEDAYRDSYGRYLGRAEIRAAELLAFDSVQHNEPWRLALGEVRADLARLAGYRERMLELLDDQLKNIPAQKIATEILNPMAQRLQSTISQMIESDYEEDNADGERDALRRSIYDLRYYNAQLMGELRTFLAFRGPASAENIRSLGDVIRLRLKTIGQAEDLYTFEQEEAVLTLFDDYSRYFTELERAIAIHASERYRTDIYLVNSEIGPLERKLQADLGRLVEDLTGHIKATSDGLQSEAGAASQGLITGLLVSVLLGVAIAWLIVYLMSIPLDAAVGAMHDLADGEGDLTRRLDDEGGSEIAEIARNYNRFAGKLQALMARVAGGIENLSRLVIQVSDVVELTREGAENQRGQTGQVSHAMKEMSTSTQEIASSAGQAAGAAQVAADHVKTGQAVVDETVSAINALAVEIETGVRVIGTLSDEVDSIGSVLDVIKGIAEQTNLLALNAAIEAARAGEQGRGFAVVADEVRTLASRTHASTTEIETMIEKLRGQAQAAVAAIGQGQSRARASVDTASNAGEALNAIIDSVGTISHMNLQIATASEQQSAVAGEIEGNVSGIAEVADENAAASRKLADTSADLAQIASELRQTVAQFKY